MLNRPSTLTAAWVLLTEECRRKKAYLHNIIVATLLVVVMKAKSDRDAYNLCHNLKIVTIGNTILSTIEPPLMMEVIDLFFRKDLLQRQHHLYCAVPGWLKSIVIPLPQTPNPVSLYSKRISGDSLGYHHGICNPTLPLADYRSYSVDRNIGQPYFLICNGASSQDEKMLRYTGIRSMITLTALAMRIMLMCGITLPYQYHVNSWHGYQP